MICDRLIFKQAEDEQISYIKPKKDYNENDRTKIIRDRFDDNMRSQMHGLHGATIGAGVGLGLAMGQRKLVSKALQKAKPVIEKEMKKSTTGKVLNPVAKKTIEIATNPKYRNFRKTINYTGGALAGAKMGYLPGRTLGDMSDLEKKSRKELNREPTESEYKRVSEFSNNGKENLFAKKYLDSPSAIIQSNKRKIKAVEKQASYTNLEKIAKSMSANKKAILATTIGGGLIGGGSVGAAVDKITPEESEKRKSKIAAGTLAGAVTGGLLGNSYSKTASKALKSIPSFARDSKDLKDLVEKELAKRSM